MKQFNWSIKWELICRLKGKSLQLLRHTEFRMTVNYIGRE